ncbi:hypothetical protein JTB14_036316 [Gonioctena quinquepunctata]|nr:hypothetical protein JTB14_036316 [Gonioctena quinquepunctata]
MNCRYQILSLPELIDSLEGYNVQSGDIDITSPEDGMDTDIDSDLSDYDHVGNICHLRPAILGTERDYVPVQHEDSEMPVQEYDFGDDNIPLATLFPNGAAHLLSEGYCSTGTVRDNRLENCPLKNQQKKLAKDKRGTHKFSSSGKVVVFQWKDNEVVAAASNFENCEMNTTLRYCRESRSKIMVPQPKIFDRMVHPPHEMTKGLLKFRRYLASSLLKSYGQKSNREKITAAPVHDVRYDKVDHLPEYSGKERRSIQCGKNVKFFLYMR